MLINELTLLQERMILVLDDYHLIDSRAVNEALAYLLDHLPPQLHLIITTREDPVLPLSRLRVRGQLTEFRAADLRFTAVEAAEFLNHAMGLQLSAEDVAALEVRTEGWIAGLQMAALSMQGRSDTSQFISAFTGSHRFILDYLVEEVLLGQPEEVRSFLIQTAILNRLCGPLCNAVTGRTDGDALLADLERENLFIIPLDDQRQWYRYHHLFSEMLRAHAAREQASQLPLFHRRAGKWYAENDSMPEAVQHALASEDVAWAADMIEQVWPAMDAQFQADLWLIWFEKIPTAITANRPVLLGAAAWAYLNRGELEAGAINIAQSQELLDQISSAENVGNAPEHIVVADPAQFKFLSASLASARAYLALAHGDIPFTLQHARYALDLYGKEDYVQRGPAAALLGLASWSIGDLETAHRALTEAMHDFERAGSMEFAISGTYGLADIRIAQGRLRDAIRTYEQVLDLVNKKGLQHIRGTADLYLGLGKLSLERGETEKATQLVQTSEEMGPQLALPDWPCRLRIAKAHLEEARGEWDTALELLDQAGRLYYPTPIPLTHPISARKAQIWVKQGRLSLAHNWVREQDLSADDPLHYLKEFEHLTLVRILLATYRSEGSVQRLQEAQTLLERLQSAAEQGERIGSVIHILILRALTHEAQSDLAAAMPPLKKALTLAAPEEYVQTFISEGPPMLRLLSEAARLGILPDYTNRLLKASGQELFTPSFSPTSLSAKTTLVQALIEPLSDRELEILQLIANGLSNQEISRKLFLALSTVKGHNRNIFGKLEVQRRTEAVARGRELGLIE